VHLQTSGLVCSKSRMQKKREDQQLLYMCLVDFKKAFDSISQEKLCMIMMDMGYSMHCKSHRGRANKMML